ncbi:MAG: DJ-1/PfpI family protein, partial [Nitrospinae bacterium]|nr:DJ-1/PfpI family protein [Nitrospinota bacterium]
MKKVLVPLAPGFEEIETITVVDILRRSGARVTVAGTREGVIEGSRGVKVVPDTLLDEAKADDFDLIVLPGGQPGTDNLKEDPRIKKLLVDMNESGKTLAAICAAPIVLEAAGVLKDRKRTSHPSVKEGLTGELYSEDRVVVDGNIVTSRGPGTAMEFALKLVELLFGKDRV